MFALVAALSDYAICNEGLYWTGALCVTAQECEGMEQYAYKAIFMCISVAPKEGVENVPSRTGDYEYVCPTGYYLSVDKTGTECIEDPTVSGQLYVAEDKKACVSDEYDCMEYMGYYAYSDENQKLCLERSKCTSDHNGYVYSHYCVTAAQCKDKSRHAYAQTRECLGTEPSETEEFDPDQKQNGVYDCGEKYLDLTGDQAKCTDKETCSGVVYKSLNVCLKVEDCVSSQKYGAFLFENESGKYCVSAETCRKEIGGYAYESRPKCEFIEPEMPGGFVKRYDGDYLYQCMEQLYVQDKAKCITYMECVAGEPRGIQSLARECISRETWTDLSARNYVDEHLTGYVHNENITEDTDPQDVCGDMDGIALLEGRMCGCPAKQYLNIDPDSDSISCLPFPETFDRDHLRIDIEYTYHGKPVTQSAGLLTFAECTKDRLKWYMAPDQQRCVYQCPPHSESVDGACTCTGGFTLGSSGECECAGYMADDGSCTIECPAWYWVVRDGRCVEESWRLITAIAVPAGVVLVGLCVGLALFLRRRRAGKRVADVSPTYM